jgi:hypothetical protein
MSMCLRQVEQPCIGEIKVRLDLEQQPVGPLLQGPLCMHEGEVSINGEYTPQ